LKISRNAVEKIQVWLIPDNNNGYLISTPTNAHT